jgi:hypothetical protein
MPSVRIERPRARPLEFLSEHRHSGKSVSVQLTEDMNCRHADLPIVEGGLGRDLLASRFRQSDPLFALSTR